MRGRAQVTCPNGLELFWEMSLSAVRPSRPHLPPPPKLDMCSREARAWNWEAQRRRGGGGLLSLSQLLEPRN